MVTRRLLTLLPLLALLAGGCRQKPGDRVVARVNGAPIRVAELAATLPAQPDSDPGAAKRRALDALVDKELIVQAAAAEGLEDSVSYPLELEQKHLVSQRLYERIVGSADMLNELDLENARKLLTNEVRVRMVEVESESLADRLKAELDRGVPLETLATKYSMHWSAEAGGDCGFLPELWVDFPMRTEVLAMEPGDVRGPLEVYGRWRIIRLEERRPADPPPPPLADLRQELEFRLKKARRYDLSQRYLTELRSGLEWNEAGVALLCGPLDSITGDLEDVPVVSRGDSYVRVVNLMRVARQFPPTLDTAMRRYAIEREVTQDLIYEDGLERGLDRLPEVRKALAARRRDLLYQLWYRREVGDKVEVPEDSLRAFYERYREGYGGQTFESARERIHARLVPDMRSARLHELLAGLRDKADIKIDERVLEQVTREMREPQPPRQPRG